MRASPARAPRPDAEHAGGEDRAALRRVRDKLLAEFAAVRRSLASDGADAAARLSTLAQALESRGHHSSSLLLDELCLAAHVADAAPERIADEERAARDRALDALGAILDRIGRAPGSVLAGLATVDALRAARGARLASESLPWSAELPAASSSETVTPATETPGQGASHAAGSPGGAPGEDGAASGARTGEAARIATLAARLRPYLQKGLLGWMRDADDTDALELLDAVFERLEREASAAPGARLLAGAGRAWVEYLRSSVAGERAVGRRVLGAIDRDLRELAGGGLAAPAGAMLRTVAHAVLAQPARGARGAALLGSVGLDVPGDLLPAPGEALAAARACSAAALAAVATRFGTAGDEADPGTVADLVACADRLAFLGEGVARREALVLASSLEEPGAGRRLARLARALTRDGEAHTPAEPDAPAALTDEPEAVFSRSLLGDLHRARSLFERFSDEGAHEGRDDAGGRTAHAAGEGTGGEGAVDALLPDLPPELMAVLEAPGGEPPAPGDEPEPSLDAIDLATLAMRARGLLEDVFSDGRGDASSGDAGDGSSLAMALKAQGLVLDDEALDNLTAVAGAMGDAHSDLERRVGSLREGLTDMARAIAGLRGQLVQLADPAGETDAGAVPPGFDAELAKSLGGRLAAMGAGLDELATLHDAVTRLTRETESLLVRQARDHVELQRGLLRSRLVPVATRAASWQAAAQRAAPGWSVHVEGGEARVDQGVLAGVSPVVEALIDRLAEAARGGADTVGPAPPVRLVVAALVAGGELNLELRGPPPTLDAPALADAEAAMLELGGGLHRLEGDGSACVLALQVPLAPPLRRVLTVDVAGETLALPLDAIEAVVSPQPDMIDEREGGARSIVHAGRGHRLERLDTVLGLAPPDAPISGRGHVVFLRMRRDRAAVLVDSVGGRSEVVARSLGPQLRAIPWLAAACITGADKPVLILDPARVIAGVWAHRAATERAREVDTV